MPPDPRPDWVLARRRALGHRIAQLRAARGLSVDGLAAAAGVDRSSVLRAEHATISTGVDVLQQLAHGLGVPPGELFAEDGPAGADTGAADTRGK